MNSERVLRTAKRHLSGIDAGQRRDYTAIAVIAERHSHVRRSRSRYVCLVHRQGPRAPALGLGPAGLRRRSTGILRWTRDSARRRPRTRRSRDGPSVSLEAELQAGPGHHYRPASRGHSKIESLYLRGPGEGDLSSIFDNRILSTWLVPLISASQVTPESGRFESGIANGPCLWQHRHGHHG